MKMFIVAQRQVGLDKFYRTSNTAKCSEI